jgi:vitamin K-dependent gamma-carboxylase
MFQFWRTYKSKMLEEVNPSSLGLFRILIGFILFIQTVSFMSDDFVTKNFVDSNIRFKFSNFEFLEPLSEQGMNLLLFAMMIASIFIMLGRFFKIATAFFGLAFTYLWLLDKSYFNNHYYFISLLVLLLFISNADAWGSLKGKNKKATIPYYQVFALKAQIFLTFFIAGINKINYYWMVKHQPMKHILEAKAELNGYDWLNSSFFTGFFSWSGLLFDLSIGFLLWIPKTRRLGVLMFIVFNLLNYWLFHDIGEIGIFPFLLLACIPIFLDPIKTSKKLEWLVPNKTKITSKSTSKPILVYILSGFLVLQLVLPFRHVLYEGHVDWNGLGQRFSWRMKIMYKEVDMHFYLVEEGKTDKLEVNLGNFLNDKQYTNLMYYPDFIPIVAQYIKKVGVEKGLKNPKVLADFKVGFNGNKKMILVDPEADLSKVKYATGNELYWLKSKVW